MKILAIRGFNLASLEGQFNIDFNEEPLKSAGIFAITGATGAGKSTLLDALCLALYNKTPRMKGDNEKVDIVDVGQHMLSSTHPGSILRKGTAEAWSEVDFMALNRKIYTARWSVARAHKKITGKLQQEEISLFNVTNQQAESGKKIELLKQITELIGLTFEQFTRTVLLAQGDFATFLKANSTEKAELLEKLTGTEIYAELSTTIFKKHKEAREQLESLENRVNAINILSDEEITALKMLIHELIEKNNISSAQQETITKQLEQQQITARMRNELLVTRKKLNDILLQKEIFDTKKELLSKVTTVQQIKPLAIKLEEVVATQQRQEKEHKQAQNNLATITVELTKAIEARKEAQNNLKKINDRYTKIQPELNKYRELTTRINEQQQQYNSLTKTYQANKDKNEKIKTARQQLQNQLNSNRENISKIDSWIQHHIAYQKPILQLDTIKELVSQKQKHTKQLTELSRQKTTLEQTIANARKRVEDATATIQKLEQTLPAEVAKLRAHLTDNAPCPVCGSLHHPFADMLTAQQQTMESDQIEKQHRDAQKIIDTNTATLIENEKRMVETAAHYTALNNQLQNTTQRLAQVVEAIPQGAQLLQQGTLITQLEQIKLLHEKTINQKNEIEQKIQELTSNLLAEKRVMEELQPAINQQENDIRIKKADIEVLISERNTLLGGKKPEEIEVTYRNFVDQNTIQVENATAAQNKLNTNQQIEISRITDLSRNIEQANTNRVKITQSIDDWKKKQQDTYINEQLDTLLSYKAEWIEEQQKAIDKHREELLTINVTLREQEQRLLQQTESYPDLDTEKQEALSVQLNLLQQDIKNNQTERAKAEGRLSINEENRKRAAQFEKELNIKRENKENWGKLNELLGQSDGSKFKKIAQQYTLDTLLVYANQQLEMLTDRYQLERSPNQDLLVLQVIDKEMMDEVRPVKTLSGGETFLISLALALGLSSLSSRRMTVESLFIDEGFGSLDPKTLTIAIEALERLHMQGRKIGVISHVAEMNERIPTRIEIIKSSGGKSNLRIVG